MARYAPLWQQAGVYPASLDRQLLQTIWPNGGTSGAVPAVVANTMDVNIPVGRVVVPLTAGQGDALCVWDAAEVVTLAAASAQPRIDLIVLQVRDNALDAGPNNDFLFTSVMGTPAASNPAVPATPANAYAMAHVLVPANAANLNGATLTNLRTSLAVPDSARVGQATQFVVSSPAARVGTWAAPQWANGIACTATGMTVSRPGLYLVNCRALWQSGGGAVPAALYEVQCRRNGSIVLHDFTQTAALSYPQNKISGVLSLLAGDLLEIWATNAAGVAGWWIANERTYWDVTRLGPST